MGAENVCCKNNEEELDFIVGKDENVFEVRFFYFYPEAKATFASLSDPANLANPDKPAFPANYANISRLAMTEYLEEGVFLGKECKVRHGLGIMIYEKEGLYYVGNWVNGNRQGLGYMLYKDGSYYKGEWFLGKAHGYGEYYSPDRKWVYKGKWKNGTKEGLGEETFPDGTVFKGHYQKDVKEGEGIITFTSECNFDDREKPSAASIKANGAPPKLKCSFKGVFKNDIACGKGVQKGENYKYEGQWANNEMHGAGKSTYYSDEGTANELYIGEFKEGKKEGFGEYRWADGRIYKGQWAEGKMLSKGVFIDKRSE